MSTGLRIPGTVVPSFFPGTPDFPRDPDFPVKKRHTAYEWAMALGADTHPYAHCIADGWGPRGLLQAASIEGMKSREAVIEVWVSETEPEERLGPRDIYNALKAEFDAGRIEPLRREWCVPRPGIDRSNEVDFTRCVFGIEQIWSLIERRGDTGQLIEEMREAFNGTGAAKPDIAASPIITARHHRVRGRKPAKLIAAKDAMKRDIATGKITPDNLRNLKEECLAATYGNVSRDTARRARKEALSEIVEK